MPPIGKDKAAAKRKKDIALIYAVTAAAALAAYLMIRAGVFHFICPFNALTGLRCPGCGNTRAVMAALSGDFAGALSHNPMFLPELALLIYFIIYLPYVYITERPFSAVSKLILTVGAVGSVIWWIVRNILNI